MKHYLTPCRLFCRREKSQCNNIVLLFLLAIFIAKASKLVVVSGKELVATNEWQPIGNLTLPAGLEIRIDLTTGEKYARLLQKEDNDENGQRKNDLGKTKRKRCDDECMERQRIRRAERRKAGFLLRGGGDSGERETISSSNSSSRSKNAKNTVEMMLQNFQKLLLSLSPANIVSSTTGPNTNLPSSSPLMMSSTVFIFLVVGIIIVMIISLRQRMQRRHHMKGRKRRTLLRFLLCSTSSNDGNCSSRDEGQVDMVKTL